MKIRKLTPAVLKRIIAEEKQRLNIRSQKRSNTSKKERIVEKRVNELTKLALLEAKERIKIKKIKKIRELIKKSLK